MAEVTLKSFLDNDSQVKAARKQLTAASAELNKQKSALAAAGTRLDAAQREALENRVAQAQANYNTARSKAQEIETTRSQFYSLNKRQIEKKATTKEVNKAKQQLEELLVVKQNQPNNPIIDSRIADLNDQINQRGKYAPKPVAKPEGAVIGDQAESVSTPRDYVSELNGAAKIVRAMSPQERQDLASVLKASRFYEGPITGVYSDALVTAYQTAIAANQTRSTAWGEEVPWGQFLQDKIAEATALGDGEGRTPTGTVSLSTPLEAAAKVEDIFKSELGRLPTPEEVDKYSKKLMAREKKQSSITKATTKKVGGLLVTEYTGGLDRDQFLQGLVRKLPEYSERKTAAKSLTIQDLQKTAMANGLSLDRNFGADVVQSWVNRVDAGEDIDIFKNLIRKTAAVGLPDSVAKLVDSGVDLETVYSPYKKTMATILEIPENSITLDDATLRSAIGPDKPMTIYDFQRQLRKDARWQYTDNAREDVSTAALRVLQDFGFQG